jgi:hypothetical protein
MKEWPKDKTETVYYEELITPVKKVLLKAYKLTSRKLKNIPYDGFNFGSHSLVGLPPPNEQLEKDMIEYHKERGRNILDIILMIAFNLGLEQGRRLEAKNTKHFEFLYESYKSMYESARDQNGISSSSKD